MLVYGKFWHIYVSIFASLDPVAIGPATDLKNRVAIVTGAGQGLGRAFAKAFAACGAVSVIVEINTDSATRVAHEIEETGGRSLVLQTDVSDYAAVERMAERVKAAFGRIDILVNNAAIFSTLQMRGFDDIPLDEWERVLKVNITGAFNCCRAVAPIMRTAQWGRIINISSGSLMLGRPRYLHYSTSKAALIGMSRSLARELGPFGITVNCLLPGATFTEIERKTVTEEEKHAIIGSQCIPRASTPDDLIGPVLFLASEGARFLTGGSILVDGGASFL